MAGGSLAERGDVHQRGDTRGGLGHEPSCTTPRAGSRSAARSLA
jgi:hypothetical protein